MSTEHTIAAIASAPGGSGRGIVRVSGPGAIECVAGLFASRHDGEETHNAAVVYAAKLTPAGFASPVPCDVYVWPGERSYTRQPTVELHVPGSPPIVAAVLEAVLRNGARPATPGEFTLRAFLAGRLDLTQAEAVLGVVDAEDRRRLDVALRQMAGGLATPLTQLRNDLLDLTAHLEAGLDFVEEDIEFIARDALITQVAAARDAVAAVLAQTAARGQSTERPRIVLFGLPNVGKSSLFNALSQQAGALVSPKAGTTRDYLSAVCTFDGVECELIDTAGVETLAATTPTIDGVAQELRAGQTRDADVVVLCLDGTRPPSAWERTQLAVGDARRFVIQTKCDLPGSPTEFAHALRVSAITGAGLAELRTAIATAAGDARGDVGDVVSATAVRCRDSLQRAATALDEAGNAAADRRGDELVAIELRTALDELGQVVGAIYTDDILDRIFSRFCIGK